MKAPPSAEVKLKEIHSLVKKNKLSLALKELDKLISSSVATDVSDDAHILAGEVSLKLNNHELAYKYFLGVVDSDYYSPLESYAITKASESLFRLGKLDESLSLVQRGLGLRNLPQAEAVNLHLLKSSILLQLGDKLEAFQSLVFLSQHHHTPEDRVKYRFKAFDFIDSNLSDEEIYSIARKSRYAPEYRAHALYKLGIQAFENKNYGVAQNYLEKIEKLSPESEIAEKAALLISQMNARKTVKPKTIGAVLPLSGRHSDVAYKTLRGLQMGLGIFGDNPSDFELAVIDSEGNPDAARRAVERLVTENHVIAIVGSLLSRTSVAVARKANDLGVPSLALSQKAGITDVGDYVYRNALTSDMQISELVRHAMDDRGMKKFAILYPNDNYGVEYANLFWDHVLARGGKIVGIQTYDVKETDFRGALARLVGKFYLDDRIHEYKFLLTDWLSKQKFISSRSSPPDELLSPIVDFDGLFVPDSTKTIGQVAPMLAYLNIKNVTLLGTNLWNTPSLVQRGQRFVEGSLFVDSLLVTDSTYQQSDFFREYISTYGSEPGIFEIQAYDAAILLRQIIGAGNTTRVDVKESLDKINRFPGAVGDLTMSSRRELSRPLVRLGVQNGKIINNPRPLGTIKN